MTTKHNHGFAHDLPKMLNRRRALTLLGGAGLSAAWFGQASAQECVAMPWEMAGPFPADGGNSRGGRAFNVLIEEGVIREDIRPSFAGMSAIAEGTPLSLTLNLVNAQTCAPLPHHAIYIWQCDAAGRYSLYNLANENYLRGLGVADNQGKVRFTTIFPGCYRGRWPHIHFEVYANVESAVTGDNSILTSQLAFTKAQSEAVYQADARYQNGTRNLAELSLSRDMIFADNSDAELAQQTLLLEGNPASGYRGEAVIALG